ncbi:isochorismatase family protein [Escherichia coli]|uniref:isochorismatase family protein n=1 Tax=Escherichia coli TaxID=562 RepID=UPI000BA7D2BF|nr:isochorismatase family protein [Escherichia coli]EEW8595961.1 isochorismatase family protein [Escherichia coli]EEW8803106.1 isochorismatase family protein [Escherichia coli]EFG9415650.1 isochorismatase family protein [Escherichia coli]EFH8693591.1 phenazine antibiotic biosynthesis protein [Escherichia coli]EFI9568847.1 isochorismatase family protein [Escherichia coli]
MAIPEIEDYDLCSVVSLMPNKVNWSITPSRSLLLVHDMQNFFLNPLPELLRNTLLTNCAQLLAWARGQSIPVVYTGQKGSMNAKERGLLYDFWGVGMDADPVHTAITPLLSPQPGEPVLKKWRYSAFFSSELANIFSDQQRDQIIICGVYAQIGILTTALDAYSRDIEVFLVRDAIADFSQAAHQRMLTYAASCCASILSVGEVTA